MFVKNAHRKPRPIGNGICEIQLTKGYVTIIDESDAHLVSPYTWSVVFGASPKPYASATIKQAGRRVHIHTFLVGIAGLYVDHINGDTLDNRRSNLRVCAPIENAQNRRCTRGAVPLKGVFRNRQKFCAKIRTEQGRIFVGSFSSAIQAALAYDAAAIKYHGEFAATNAELGLIESAIKNGFV
jgi:hypothetical protein